MQEKRVIYKTTEYVNFYNGLDDIVIKKIDYLETIIRSTKVISSKKAKKLLPKFCIEATLKHFSKSVF